MKQIINRYMDMELNMGEDFLEAFYIDNENYSLGLVLRSYCLSQYMIMVQQNGNIEAMKMALLSFKIPTAIPCLREAMESDLTLLETWTKHTIRLYQDFFSSSEERKSIFFWRQYRNYIDFKRFVAGETNSITATYHEDTCLKPMAAFLTQIGKEVLTDSVLKEALEEEAQYSLAAREEMEAILTELKLLKGGKCA